ncbi:MAG: hypothetical protein JWQ88_931 [Rhodoferax sp.]|nr:hypothetical protein [Rhodoferax sp.]
MASSTPPETPYTTRSATHTATRSNSNPLDWIALILMIIGAINWGLVGALNVDLVALLFGNMTTAARIVYGLVGLAGIYGISMLFKGPPSRG